MHDVSAAIIGEDAIAMTNSDLQVAELSEDGGLETALQFLAQQKITTTTTTATTPPLHQHQDCA